MAAWKACTMKRQSEIKSKNEMAGGCEMKLTTD